MAETSAVSGHPEHIYKLTRNLSDIEFDLHVSKVKDNEVRAGRSLEIVPPDIRTATHFHPCTDSYRFVMVNAFIKYSVFSISLL